MIQLDQIKSTAVVGVSESPEKYGTRVYRTLKTHKNTEVFAINPKHDELWGDKVYPDLVSIGQNIELAILVVPPEVGLNVIDEVKLAGISTVWLQPGAESEQILEKCDEYGIECIHNACIVVDGYHEQFLDGE